MPRKTKQSTNLPPLPFKNAGAEVQTDIGAYRDRMATVVTGLNEYAALGGASKFSSKSATVNINGLKLVASANTPVAADIGRSKDITLMVPFVGQNRSTVGKSGFDWRAHEEALFIPAIGRGGESTTRSSLMVDLDQSRLQKTARAMLGLGEHAEVDLRLHETRILPLRGAQQDFDGVFRHLCGVIDSVGGDERLLSSLGVDELFYRAIVTMLRSDLFSPASDGSDGQHKRRDLDPVCDFIRTNLSEALSLSDLERFSGLSSRSLQYAFQQRFGCTPMQWLREERLMSARHALQKIPTFESILDIAIMHGFPNPSAFSAYYRRRFGELPSETIGRGVGKTQ